LSREVVKMMPAVWEEFRRLEERMNQLFRELMGGEGERRFFTPFEGVRTPFCDVQETDSEVIITAELPGVSKEDIQINATENEVEIKAERRSEQEEKSGSYLRRERTHTSFYRRIALPAEVQAEKAKAKYRDGVLELRLPKKKARQKSQIKVE